jgi:hypothetical protein
MVRLAKPAADVTGEPVVHYQRLNNIHINYPKSELRTADDVEDYVDALKIVLKDLIKQNKRITL